MNKLFTKIVGVALGASMAVGVGVAVANNKEVAPVHAASQEWELVTSAPSDWSGTYILCNGTSDTVKYLQGSTFSSSSAAGVDVTVSNSKITVDDTNALTIAKSSTSGKYTVKVNGKFIGRNANSNGIDASETWSTNYNNEISYSSSKVVIKGNGGRVLTWFAQNSNFRYYASSNNSSQLFKKVESKTLSSISVTTSAHRTFVKGDEFVKETITATYSDESKADVTSSASFSGYDMATAGNYTVNVSYTESGVTQNASYSIAVKELSGIAVTTPPTKTTYTEGQSFDPAGMVVTATYSDESTADVTSSCTFTPNPLTEGLTEVTVSYGDKTTTQAVTVNAAPGYAKITDLTKADKVLITAVKDGIHYIVPAATTSSGPTATVVSVVNDKVIGDQENNLFTVSKDSNGNFAFANSDGKYLLNTNDNNGVRINGTSANYWAVSEADYGFKMINSSRYLGVYGTSNWRSYTSSTQANYKGTDGKSSAESINFYGITKEITPLDSISLTNYPTSDLEINDTCELGYYGLDTEGEVWTGDVVYTSSNASAVTIDENGLLKAVGAGSSNITVYANAGIEGAKVESDPVSVTVLADPERIDLPIGNYSVNISASGKSKGDPIPDTSFEIKPKEGRTWYKNLTASYTDMSVQYPNEYSLEPTTGAIEFTNNSNAKITTVTIDWYTDNGYAASDLYVGSSATPESYTTSSGSGTVYTYTLNTDEDIRIHNPSDSKRSSFYTMTINFEVIDESEEFYNLVVSKSASWDKTSYKDGQSPSSEGLIATANFTKDGGETISRSQDVTSQVSKWAYTPSILHTGDTSFSVVATWNSHDSASFSVTGITVAQNTGPIPSGRYYIMTHDSAYGMNAIAYTSSHPVAIDLSESNELTAFDVTLVADNEYEISTTIENVKYYLVNNSAATSSANDNIKITNTPLETLKSTTWSLDAVEGGYNVKQNTTGTTYRYLSCYGSADWRGYVNTNYGDPIIKFVAEGSYANEIVDAIMSTEQPLCNGGVTAPSVSRWNEIAGITYIQNELSILTGTEAAKKDEHGETPTGTKAEKAMARYDEIMVSYNTLTTTTYVDFLGRIEAHDLPIKSSRTIFGTILGDNSSTVAIIIVVSAITLTSIGGYFFIRRRKKQY